MYFFFRGSLHRNDPRGGAGVRSAQDHQRGAVPEQPRERGGVAGLRAQPRRETQRGQQATPPPPLQWRESERKVAVKAFRLVSSRVRRTAAETRIPPGPSASPRRRRLLTSTCVGSRRNYFLFIEAVKSWARKTQNATQ